MGLEKGDCACAESRGRVCESRALFFRHPEEAGGQSTREPRRVQHGCGSLAWVSEESGGPGRAWPGAPLVILPRGKRHQTRFQPLFSGCTGQVFYQMIHGNAEFKKSPFPCSKPEDSFPLHIA
ncbi:PREDICTED: pyridoxal phosphate phosphatase PHOSPHO2 isoform X2 [Capra hircus]|uniref:pyridoxal phosphate phosphatase PHOSPHO2 isoform X2 n=1 Tax=Capra hircus TaxID=9925 RepID=UPI000847A278|nr:PREDICTED: pyridoxal phosphate phosphatase PHOSPHO2 isoform X2 [Capra hircus]